MAAGKLVHGDWRVYSWTEGNLYQDCDQDTSDSTVGRSVAGAASMAADHGAVGTRGSRQLQDAAARVRRHPAVYGLERPGRRGTPTGPPRTIPCVFRWCLDPAKRKSSWWGRFPAGGPLRSRRWSRAWARLSWWRAEGDIRRRAGGTACPTSEDAGLVVVAQAVPPAQFRRSLI